jgi:RimJ/RimL family protein N-acetyltransferase
MRHMGHGTLSRAESAETLERHRHHWDEHGFGLWAAEEKASGALVGRAGIAYHRVWPHDPEVGWLIDTSWQGRGLATEVGAACVRHAFNRLGFERVVSICIQENAASRRVMEKLGFRLQRDVEDPLLAIRLWIHALDRAIG